MRKQGTLIKGVGSQDVPIAVGALVLLYGSDDVAFLYKGRHITARCFKLSDDHDTVEVRCRGGDDSWSIEWFPIKPKYEQPDPTPVAIPAGYHHPESLESTIARLVRRQVSDIAKAEGYDAEEEEDFDDDEDEVDQPTKYEYEEIGARAEKEQRRHEQLQRFIASKRQARRRAQPRQEANSPAEPAQAEDSDAA